MSSSNTTTSRGQRLDESKTQLSTDGPNSESRIGGYTVRIEQLAPYPLRVAAADQAEDWRVTVRIKSATRR